jgi:chemotaxis protein methyltransferase CheR
MVSAITGKSAVETFFDKIEDARKLAQVIVDTIREPLLVLDVERNVLFASGSFHRVFQIDATDTENRPLFTLDDGAWNIPAVRGLLDATSGKSLANGLEITHDFPRIGTRTLLLHAREADHANTTKILLGIEDITARRAVEHEREHLKAQTDDLLRQKGMLLEEMQHRIVNSLQIIASILMMKARAVTSEETRQHLQDAHRRVMSVAAVQKYLHSSVHGELIEIAPYLKNLCESLAESMIGESGAKLEVIADSGKVLSSDAVSIGLIITELVINALKYAFPDGRKGGTVVVRYEVNGTDWNLSVSDNGAGKRDTAASSPAKGGLGTSLVNALAHQLDATVKPVSSVEGVNVSISHATFTARARA